MLIEVDQELYDKVTCHLRLLDRYYDLPNADSTFMEAARPIVVGITALRGAFYVPSQTELSQAAVDEAGSLVEQADDAATTVVTESLGVAQDFIEDVTVSDDDDEGGDD